MYEHFDVLFVSDLFPGANTLLQQRLGNLIIRRRVVLRLRRQRNQDLKRARVISEPSLQAESQSTVALNIRAINYAADSHIDRPPASSIVATTCRPLHALKPNPETLLETSLSDVDTMSSVGSTQSQEDVLPIPSRPRGTDGLELENFECNYCCTLVQITSSCAWV